MIRFEVAYETGCSASKYNYYYCIVICLCVCHSGLQKLLVHGVRVVRSAGGGDPLANDPHRAAPATSNFDGTARCGSLASVRASEVSASFILEMQKALATALPILNQGDFETD